MTKNYYLNFFNTTAADYLKKVPTNVLSETKVNLIKRFGKKGGIALEIGSANGIISLEVAKYFKKIIGVDYSQDMVDEGVSLLNRNGIRNIDLIKMNACKLSFRDGVFDTVYCFSTLTYIENWKAALEEMVRVLKKDGVLIVDIINGDNLEGRYWNQWHKKNGAWGQKLFKYQELHKIFRDLHLEMIEISGIGVIKQLEYIPIIGYLISKIYIVVQVQKFDFWISTKFLKMAARWLVVAKKI